MNDQPVNALNRLRFVRKVSSIIKVISSKGRQIVIKASTIYLSVYKFRIIIPVSEFILSDYMHIYHNL